MSIDSLRSGAIRICFDPSLNQIANKCRVLFEGQMLDTGNAEPDTLIKIPSLRNIDELFGNGSVLAEGLRTAFACCATQPYLEFYALPRMDADVGATTKAVYTLTVVGPATTDGGIELFAGDGRWNIIAPVNAGDTAEEIAQEIADEYSEREGFPFDVTVAVGVVTFTAKNAGTVGNYLNLITNWRQRQDFFPEGVELTFVQTVTATNAEFTNLDYSAILGECCYCCVGMLYDTPDWQDGMIAYLKDAWSCDKPQCFGHGYTYNSGTLGQILATDTNSPEVSRMAHCATDPSLGWLKTAAYAALSCCETVTNPETNIQGPEFGVLRCVVQPESCFQCFTFDDQQILQESGFVVTVPTQGGTGAMTSPMVVNDVTNNRYDDEGRLNPTWWAVSSRRLAAATADAIAVNLSTVLGLGLFTKNTTIPERVRGTNPRLILGQIRVWAKANIGVLFSEFDDIDKDIQLQTDFERAPKCLGQPGKLWLDFTYRPPVRISNITINARPALLTNC